MKRDETWGKKIEEQKNIPTQDKQNQILSCQQQCEQEKRVADEISRWIQETNMSVA